MRDQGKSSALSGKDRARSCLLQTLQRSRNEQLLPNEAAEYVAIWTRFVIFRLYGPLLSVRTVISRLIAGITERTVRWRRDTPTSGWATSGWATSGWATPGMGDAGDGRRRGWAASGMGGACYHGFAITRICAIIPPASNLAAVDKSYPPPRIRTFRVVKVPCCRLNGSRAPDEQID
jgi:hypothetical protein